MTQAAPTSETQYTTHVWDEGQEPQPLPVDKQHFSTSADFLLRSEAAVREALETKQFARITAFRDGKEVMSLWYSATTDSQRGRHMSSGVTLADAWKNLLERQQKYDTTKCFTPQELYALAPIDSDCDPYFLIQVHLSDELGGAWALDINAVEASRRVEIRDLANHCADGRRTWTLQTVWFDGKPVMVVNSSGRDGDEYHNRYITDRELFESMIAFLRSFSKQEEIEGFVPVDKVIPDMTEFYSATLHDYYDVTTQSKKD